MATNNFESLEIQPPSAVVVNPVNNFDTLETAQPTAAPAAPSPPPAVKVVMPCWAKCMLVGLLLLSAYTLYRAESSAEAQVQLYSSISELKKELTWTKEKKQLTLRAVKAEKGEQALKAELGRVYANLQGKNYTPPEDPEDADEDRPDEPEPFDYNSCNKEEHYALCALIKDNEDYVIQKSRDCASRSLGWSFKKNKFKKCFIQEIPALSEHCASCFADAAHWGYSNCKFACASQGPKCEQCVRPHAEDHRRCMGFLLPGYGLPADCPIEVGE